MGLPAHLEMALDFANGPFGPVKSMQVIDLVSRQHGSLLFIRQKRFPSQKDVVCKAGVQDLGTEQALLQILGKGGPGYLFASSTPAPTMLLRNALGRELRCCLQAGEDAACDHGASAAGDSSQPLRDVACGNAPSNPDGGLAIFGGCRGKPLAVLRIGGNLVSVVFGSIAFSGMPVRRRQWPRLKLGKLKGFWQWRQRSVIQPLSHPLHGGTGGDRPLPSRFRNCCRVHTASPPMSSLRTAIKPLRVF